MTNFQFVNANEIGANIVNTLAWYSIAVLSRLFQVLQHTPSNLSGMQLNTSDFYSETVPSNVNLLVDQSYANYFQSCKQKIDVDKSKSNLQKIDVDKSKSNLKQHANPITKVLWSLAPFWCSGIWWKPWRQLLRIKPSQIHSEGRF